jgi:hypothetical protein
MSEQHKYRQFTPEQKTEIVLAGLRGDRSVRDVCREYQIAETGLQTSVPSDRMYSSIPAAGGQLAHGGQFDAEQLRAPFQRRRDRPAHVRVVPGPPPRQST